jgi:cytochrome c oxidase subunit 1
LPSLQPVPSAAPLHALPQPEASPRAMIWAYLAVSGAVFVLMMALGVMMRFAQAGLLPLSPGWFYRVMTLHGVGMVGISGLAGAAIMWHFASRHLDLSPRILAANLALFLAGVVLLFGPVLLAGYAGAWTFLYPLPRLSGGAWTPLAAAVHLSGLLLVGVGFLLLHLDVARAIFARYGSLGRALGWPQLFRGSREEPPPPAIVASTMVLIVNILGLVSGAGVLAMSIVNLLVPSFDVDPLLAKNMIFFFGHVFINATIYMSVIAVYEILPVYAGRPWKVSRTFLAAWTASTVMVVIVYPHHLLMDLAMPAPLRILGQVVSYASGLPVLLVTALGGLSLVYRSGIRWDVAASLLFLSLFGWAAGVIPAVIDGTIAMNRVLHNTQWVPGHFHFYLLIGLVSMIFGFMYYASKRGRDDADDAWDRGAFYAFLIGALGVVFTFLAAGKAGVPRRFAVHLPEWVTYSTVGACFGVLVVGASLIFLSRFVARLRVAS